MNALAISYVAVGYWLFWAALTDPHTRSGGARLAAATFAITVGPAAFFGIWLFAATIEIMGVH